MRTLHYLIPDTQDGIRVESYLRQELLVSASLLRRLKIEQGILRNGAPIRSVDSLFSGDTLTLQIQDSCDLVPNPSLQAPVVYADEDLVIYQKPAQMPVHPSLRHYEDTLGNQYAASFSGGFHPINRLDSNTMGLCLIARHPYSTALLSKQVQKEYTALVCGILPDNHGSIVAPIAREDDSIIRRIVSPDGQHAVTHYQVLERFERYTLVRVLLETGRTHQIRVHFAHLGYPLAGDDMYGGDCSDYATQMLTCTMLSFPHPIHKNMQTFRIDMQNLPDR